ncbi:Peptide N-acetyl-beta-D-glucosaminyl asparaginase amidase A [Musa troglodytarum]|uniref:Peptide N-acetyl-beta-D-glucosaminyl asparaginase amidase A n=1 Tax=Musa troglodytarum TaxID=320322 RepID=A0A9E7GEW8_9LILI|nr:Peptide N-acetyl-beta-D-glucosaminyl asparaginase amidase A [Musa troglodytarum]
MKLAIPTNAYLSFHSADEFWYTNPPDTCIFKNNLTDLPRNGAFGVFTRIRDGDVVGAVWPFTVIDTHCSGGPSPASDRSIFPLTTSRSPPSWGGSWMGNLMNSGSASRML